MSWPRGSNMRPVRIQSKRSRKSRRFSLMDAPYSGGERRSARGSSLDERNHLGTALASERIARRPHTLAPASHNLLGKLDGLDKVVSGVEMQEWHEPAIDASRSIQIALLCGVPERQRFLREHICQTRHPTAGAKEKRFERNIVEAREEC